MQVVRLFFLFFFIFIPKSYSSLSELTCSQNGTYVVFINGVNVNDEGFKDFGSIAAGFASGIEKNKVDHTSFEDESLQNSSANVLYDAAETYFEFLKSTGISNPSSSEIYLEILMASFTNNFTPVTHACSLLNGIICEKAYEILIQSEIKTVTDIQYIYSKVKRKLHQDKRVIFISHSGGAVITDRVRDMILSRDGDFYNLTSHIALARPFKSVHQKVLNYSFDKDPVLKILRQGSNNVPNSNVQLINDCPGSILLGDFLRNHNFSCYLSNIEVIFSGRGSSDEFVKSLIYKQASEFKNNDEKCCNKADGKVWLNSFMSPGGFVASTVNIIGEKLWINDDSSVCGEGEIDVSESNVLSVISNKTKLDGTLKIKGPINFSKVTSSLKSTLKIASGAAITDSIIDGEVKIETLPPYSSLIHKGKIETKASLLINRGRLDNTDIDSGTVVIRESSIEDSKINGNLELQNSSLERVIFENYFSNDAYLNFMSISDSTINVSGPVSLEFGGIGNSNISVSGTLHQGVGANNINNVKDTNIFFDVGTKNVRMNDVDAISEEPSIIEFKGESIFLEKVSNKGKLELNSFSNIHSADFIGVNQLKDVQIISNGGGKYSVINSTALGENSAEIRMNSNLVEFVGHGKFDLRGTIGSSVKIYGNVTNWFFNIADNTTVYGPITLGCDVSGIIYSDYECP